MLVTLLQCRRHRQDAAHGSRADASLPPAHTLTNTSHHQTPHVHWFVEVHQGLLTQPDAMPACTLTQRSPHQHQLSTAALTDTANNTTTVLTTTDTHMPNTPTPSDDRGTLSSGASLLPVAKHSHAYAQHAQAMPPEEVLHAAAAAATAAITVAAAAGDIRHIMTPSTASSLCDDCGLVAACELGQLRQVKGNLHAHKIQHTQC